jgi:hypothetical protein
MISMKLRGRGIVANLSFLFLNDEWGMRGCEEGRLMMML